jgi:hypothetical protein
VPEAIVFVVASMLVFDPIARLGDQAKMLGAGSYEEARAMPILGGNS